MSFYRGEAPALTDLIGGQVQIFGLLPATIEYFKSGTLRPVAVTTTVRSELLPEVPAVREFVPGFEASYWAGVGAPRNTPVEIIQRLNKEINAGLADPKLKASALSWRARLEAPRCPARLLPPPAHRAVPASRPLSRREVLASSTVHRPHARPAGQRMWGRLSRR
jgi:Tripartite tricarboxylate transporter family receptor